MFNIRSVGCQGIIPSKLPETKGRKGHAAILTIYYRLKKSPKSLITAAQRSINYEIKKI
jgi:hypothetical protein